jgi:hypothetical protein
MFAIRNERGVALAVAVFALVIVGGLVGGALFLGMQEQRVGLNSMRHQQAFAAAEEGAQLQLARWDPEVLNVLAVGSDTAYNGTLPNGTGWYRGSVRRLNDELFLVRSEGFSPDSQTRQQVGLLVRLRPIEININAALKTQGATKIGGSSLIDGNDQAPAGWTCPPLEPALPGIRIPDPSDVTTSGCGGNDTTCVVGDPKILEDPTIDTGTLTTFGDVEWDDLVGLASKVLTGGNVGITPVVSGGTCDTGVLTNWGDPLDPTGPCGNYFPIIYSENTLRINGDRGQGVLIVNGDLEVQGNFEFFGPVIVKGHLKTTGTGGHFNGGVIAANVDLEQNTVLGNAVVNFSSCALLKALNGSASAALLQERSWVNLF